MPKASNIVTVWLKNPNVIPLDTFVFNTEAHPIRIPPVSTKVIYLILSFNDASNTTVVYRCIFILSRPLSLVFHRKNQSLKSGKQKIL